MINQNQIVKQFWDRLSRLDTIPMCNGQTDRQTLHDGKDSAMQSIAWVKMPVLLNLFHVITLRHSGVAVIMYRKGQRSGLLVAYCFITMGPGSILSLVRQFVMGLLACMLQDLHKQKMGWLGVLFNVWQVAVVKYEGIGIRGMMRGLATPLPGSFKRSKTRMENPSSALPILVVHRVCICTGSSLLGVNRSMECPVRAPGL